MATMTTHEQYRPQEYTRQNFARDHEFPPQSSVQYNGQMTTYQPPTAVTRPFPQPQGYQQNTAAFEPVYNSTKTRRSPTTDRHRRRPSGEEEDDFEPEPEPEPEQKTATTGGPLAGAASGALLGANIGGGKGFRTAGTLGGMVTGAWVGHTMERSFKDKRQEKQDSEQEAVDSAQREQDRYDEEYTKVANAAPGYGSILLPGDNSHGGPLNRNSRTSPAS